MSKEREIIEGQINDHQEAIDKAKLELKALDEPKLEHGDYGIEVSCNDNAIVIKPNLKWPDEVKLIAIDKRGNWNYVDTDYGKLKFNKGNIFTDLSRLSEPLEQFRVKDRRDSNLARFKVDGGLLKIFAEDRNCIISVFLDINKEAQELYDNLGRLLHTARNKSEKSLDKSKSGD